MAFGRGRSTARTRPAPGARCRPAPRCPSHPAWRAGRRARCHRSSSRAAATAGSGGTSGSRRAQTACRSRCTCRAWARCRSRTASSPAAGGPAPAGAPRGRHGRGRTNRSRPMPSASITSTSVLRHGALAVVAVVGQARRVGRIAVAAQVGHDQEEVVPAGAAPRGATSREFAGSRAAAAARACCGRRRSVQTMFRLLQCKAARLKAFEPAIIAPWPIELAQVARRLWRAPCCAAWASSPAASPARPAPGATRTRSQSGRGAWRSGPAG
jgi:hypothetical protein